MQEQFSATPSMEIIVKDKKTPAKCGCFLLLRCFTNNSPLFRLKHAGITVRVDVVRLLIINY